ncbi:hypothetical protein LMG28614_01375 [Paraburkholderia ultramafica]|uniref:Uncharacterized protein n=1 Tax=Paraburkholderia ultramafica TaxID=1544867 RepID=A0A6S7CKN4_9BURK|nr:hypothetical protein LMG28614_01375 [Paraburkholderia ultramafica]
MSRFSFRRAARSHGVVGDIAAQAGKLGIEICDVSGHVEEVGGRHWGGVRIGYQV